jgi:hypothetical protein
MYFDMIFHQISDANNDILNHLLVARESILYSYDTNTHVTRFKIIDMSYLSLFYNGNLQF